MRGSGCLAGGCIGGCMATSISFVVPGKPVAKGRPRMAMRTTKHGSPMVYTPKTTVTYEASVRLLASHAMGGHELLDGPLMVAIEAYLPIPRSWSKKRRMAAVEGGVLPEVKPDLDNIVKSILDGCESVVFHDDKQVCELAIVKRYCATPQVKVKISGIQ